MGQPESRLQRHIRHQLEMHYGPRIFVFKVWGSEHMMAGLPDLIGGVDGQFFGLEVKRPETKGKVSPRQEYVIGKIRAAGGIAGIVTTLAEALELLPE